MPGWRAGWLLRAESPAEGLEPDDVGAQVAQDPGAEGSHEDRGEVDHPDAGESPRAGPEPLRSRRGTYCGPGWTAPGAAPAASAPSPRPACARHALRCGWRPTPGGSSRVRGVRGLLDGLVSVVLPAYLGLLGFRPRGSAWCRTATLVGSAVLTLAVALGGAGTWRAGARAAGGRRADDRHRRGLRRLSGLAALVVVGLRRHAQPHLGGCLGVPAHRAGDPAPDHDRHASGRRCSPATPWSAPWPPRSGRWPPGCPMPWPTGWVGPRRPVGAWPSSSTPWPAWWRSSSTAGSSPAAEPAQRPPRLGAALRQSRRVVLRLSALFSLDSFAGGFTVQSMLALWLFLRFDLSARRRPAWCSSGRVCSPPARCRCRPAWPGASGWSTRWCSPTCRRRGCWRRRRWCLPPPPAVVLLVARSFLSAMDVPARTSYVMAVVPPEERAAAAGVTNVPRSLAAAAGPALAGWMLSRSTFGWPLLVAAGSRRLRRPAPGHVPPGPPARGAGRPAARPLHS